MKRESYELSDYFNKINFNKKEYVWEVKDDLYFNIIGIGKTGKDILDSIDDFILDYFIKNRFYTHVRPSFPLYIKVLGDFYLKKYYINDLSNVINIKNNRSIRNNYYNIIIYDDCDYDLANELVKDLGKSLFLNIGICINGNKKIEDLKVIETNIMDAKDVAISLILHLYPVYSPISIIDEDYKEFLEKNYNFKAYNLIDKSIENIHNALKKRMDEIKENVVGALLLIGEKKTGGENGWTVMKIAILANIIREKIGDDKWFCYVNKEGYMNDEIVTVIYKIKE